MLNPIELTQLKEVTEHCLDFLCTSQKRKAFSKEEFQQKSFLINFVPTCHYFKLDKIFVNEN